jgi:hypothetical protein
MSKSNKPLYRVVMEEVEVTDEDFAVAMMSLFGPYLSGIGFNNE